MSGSNRGLIPGNIFLTGFMGCGKTSVGRVLAQRLGYRFVDLDLAIVEQAGASVKEIFAEKGEPEFRRLESRALEGIAAGTGSVVSTGGGVVLAEGNRALMRGAGVIVNLTATVEALVARLVGDSERPLLEGDPSGQRIRNMLETREPFYADADLRIDTSNKSVDAVATEILDALKGCQ